jgi:hypothetical protein
MNTEEITKHDRQENLVDDQTGEAARQLLRDEEKLKSCSGLGNAERLVRKYGQKFRYSSNKKTGWYTMTDAGIS